MGSQDTTMKIASPVKETVKEALRIAVCGALSALVLWLQEKAGGLDPSSLQYAVLAVILRLADKFEHNRPTKRKGLLPF